MASQKVIVFGPTGQVGSAAALTAHALGAEVALAMRDTNKAIPKLDADAQKSSRFQKVQADLTKPETVREAIKATGAKHAFIYAAHGSPDHMRATIETLKESGVELVVFLSSFTVQDDLKSLTPEDFIPYLHAQVEINLEAVFGQNSSIAIRAGAFASNSFSYKAGLNSGKVKLYAPNVNTDMIAPEDIGKVCGTILAKGPQDDQRKIYIYGPRLMTNADTVSILAKTMGKHVEVASLSEQEFYKMMTEEQRVPLPFVNFMVSRLNKAMSGQGSMFGYSVSDAELANVEKYSGQKATTFEEWAEQNKNKFMD